MNAVFYKIWIQVNGIEAILSVCAWSKDQAKEKFKTLGFPCHNDWIFQ